MTPAPAIEAISWLHLANATAKKLVSDGVVKVGLLGTQFTMSQDFYKDRLINRNGVDVLVPDEVEQALVHNIIYSELCQVRVNDESRRQCLGVIESLSGRGAETIILGYGMGLLLNLYHAIVPDGFTC